MKYSSSVPSIVIKICRPPDLRRGGVYNVCIPEDNLEVDAINSSFISSKIQKN